MNIRKANLSDAKRLSTLALSLKKYYNNNLEISPFFAKKITVEAFEGYLKNKEAYEHYVCEEGENIIAYCSLLNATHFLYLFVDETYHKKGIANDLIAYAIKGKEHTFYSVNSSLYAVEFYKKLGFVASALVQKHYGMSYQPMIWDKTKC